MARVSIGLPVYNGAKYLEQSIRSILEQTFEDFELVISDNASTDATEEICRHFADEDARIRYVRSERNLGGAPNFNRVFSLSSGMYFKWHTHDDVIGSRYLESCLAPLERDPSIVMSFPRIAYIDTEGRTTGRQMIDDLSILAADPARRVGRLITFELESKDIFWAGAFGLSRRDALTQTQLLGSYNAADQVLIFQLLLLGKWVQIGEELYFRRDHPEASMAANRTPTEVLRWFNPDVRKKIILTQWKVLFEHVASVRRADLTPSAEARSYWHIGRRFIGREWRNLAGDLKLAVRDLAARPAV